MTNLNVKVNNLECSSCAKAIEKALDPYKKDNAISFSIILASKKVKINFDETKIDKQTILSVLKSKGFDYQEI